MYREGEKLSKWLYPEDVKEREIPGTDQKPDGLECGTPDKASAEGIGLLILFTHSASYRGRYWSS